MTNDPATADAGRLEQVPVRPRHRMIDRVAVVGNMPPTGPRLSADEIQLLRKWISGMPRPSSVPESDADVLDTIADGRTLSASVDPSALVVRVP